MLKIESEKIDCLYRPCSRPAPRGKIESVRTHSEVIEQFDSFSLLKLLFLVRNWHCRSLKAFPRQMTLQSREKNCENGGFSTPVQLSCLSAVSKNLRFSSFFSALGCHLARKSFWWPAMPVSNKKKEFEQRKRIKLFGDFWVRAYRFDFAPEAPASSKVDVNSRVMVLLRKGVLTSGCTHVHTSQFRSSVYLQLYLSIQFSVVFALDRCSWVRWLSGSLLCRNFVEIVTKPVLSFRKGSDDMATVPGRAGFEELRRSTRSNLGRLPVRYPAVEPRADMEFASREEVAIATPAANSTVLPEDGGECEFGSGTEFYVHEDETAEAYVRSFMHTSTEKTSKTDQDEIDESHARFSSKTPPPTHRVTPHVPPYEIRGRSRAEHTFVPEEKRTGTLHGAPSPGWFL